MEIKGQISAEIDTVNVLAAMDQPTDVADGSVAEAAS